MRQGKTVFLEIVSKPIPRGSVNRLGPAEPGLNNSVRPYLAIVGRWL
jgi:hypothetical protein